MLIRHGGFVIKGNRGIGVLKTTFPNPYIVATKGIYTEKSEGFRRPLILFNLPCFEKHLLVLQVRFRTDT